MDWKAPFLPYENIKPIAHDFLIKFHGSLEIPIPIDLIAERDLGLAIIPSHEMQNVYGIEGFLSKDCSSINVDQYVMENRLYRYRFTIAHEIGHLVLHRGLYDNAQYETTEDWIAFVNQIEAAEYGWAERQAYWFAGLVLLPPEVFAGKFNDYVARATEQGYPIKIHFDEFIQFIAAPLGREFEVSADVVDRQIRYEGLKP
jgi:hypothetical protein